MSSFLNLILISILLLLYNIIFLILIHYTYEHLEWYIYRQVDKNFDSL